MNYFVLALILIIGVFKGRHLYNDERYDQLLLVIAIIIWAIWITQAVFKNWDLPAPFAYDEGRNKIGRTAYLLLVLCLFIFTMTV